MLEKRNTYRLSLKLDLKFMRSKWKILEKRNTYILSLKLDLKFMRSKWKIFKIYTIKMRDVGDIEW